MGIREQSDLASQNLDKALKETIDKQMANIEQALNLCRDSLKLSGKILMCGNGGSAGESQHFAAELTNRFKKNRKAIPAISLTTDTSLITSCGNDFSFDNIFSRQIEALGNQNDVLFCFSTSGNSRNIVKASEEAKKKGIKIISLTGNKPNLLEFNSDVTIKAQSDDTARIQEIHLFIIHMLSEIIEIEYGN